MTAVRLDVSGATNDDHLISLWMKGRPDNTARVYQTAIEAFRLAVPKALVDVTVADVIEWADRLPGRPATRARQTATVKSLLSFAWRTGYVSVNVGRVMRCVKVPDELHERILDVEVVRQLAESCPPGRDRTLVRVLYGAGIRLSEAIGLRPIDVGTGRVTVLGKGGRNRTVLVGAPIIDALRELCAGMDAKDIIFRSRTGRPLGERDARDIVYRAAKRIGLRISPHWLRHCHSSHALDRGCPIHILQHSLGHKSVATTSRYLHVRPSTGSGQWVEGLGAVTP